MAHTKAIGTTQLGRDSQPKYLGLKLHDGQIAKIGSIIVRQRGSKYLAGKGVRQGSDYTIYATSNGKVKFTAIRKKNYDGSRRVVKVVNVV
jgi:large subunit ribosomal protein L27